MIGLFNAWGLQGACAQVLASVVVASSRGTCISPTPAFLEGLEGGSMGNMGSPPVLIWLGRHEPLMELCREVAPDLESAII